MLNNLYTFKKDSKHVKFFTWLWGVNPVEKFKTMCPYFWSWVATIFLIPFILLFKLLGGGTNKINNYLINYKENRREKLINKLINKIKEVVNSKKIQRIKDELFYDIYLSKCFQNFKWYVGQDLYGATEEGYDNHKEVVKLNKRKYRIVEEKKSELPQLKDKKWVKYVVFTVIGITSIVLLYVIGLLLIAAYNLIPWIDLFIVFGGLIIGVLVLFGLRKFVLVPLYEKVICNIKWENTWLFRTLNWCWFKLFGTIGRGFISGIVIFVDMISNQYKKSCPIITWEDK